MEFPNGKPLLYKLYLKQNMDVQQVLKIVNCLLDKFELLRPFFQKLLW